MKSELQTARELYKNWDNTRDRCTYGIIVGHLQTCKRWLGFLRKFQLIYEPKLRLDEEYCDKISDLQDTIKFYEDKGVK